MLEPSPIVSPVLTQGPLLIKKDSLGNIGQVSLGDRAKVRLLVGDRAHLGWLSAAEPTDAAEVPWRSDDNAAGLNARPNHLDGPERRALQEKAESGGMSIDTIAIVLTVLVGAAGYIVQAYTAQRTERGATEQAKVDHFAEQTRQREHECASPIYLPPLFPFTLQLRTWEDH